MLTIHNVSKRFGGLQVLKGISLEIPKGQICGLIGPNGAGKTTFFNMISGLLHPDEGHIYFVGHDITYSHTHTIANLGIGRTFQIVRPYAHLTARQSLIPGLLYAGKVRSMKQAQEEAGNLLKLVGLEAKADTLGEDLTLSEKKRLEIARALAVKPKLLLLDECFAGLSPSDVDRQVKLIQRICKELSITILLVEHVLRATMALCERIVVIAAGEIVADGSPAEVVRNEKVIEVYLGRGRAANA